MAAPVAAPTHAPPAPGVSPGPSPAPTVPVYTGFRQGGWGYLLPAATVVGIVAVEHVRPLTAPVAGWAGTLAMRGGALPVLDAAALLGHGTPGRVIAIVQAMGGPLGLAVEQISGRQGLGDAPLVPLVGAPGIAAGVVHGDEVWLALAPDHLAALRRAAVGHDAAGQPAPQPVTWASVPMPGVAQPSPDISEAPRVGDPLLVLGDRAADDPDRYLALPLRDVRAVAHAGRLRPGLPGAPAIVGYRAWGRLPVPAVGLGALGITAPRSTSAPGAVRQADAYAVLLAVTIANQTLGIALLSAGARGVQRLERTSRQASGDHPTIIARGETAAVRVAVLGPNALAAAIDPRHRQASAP
jgi:chemotaxis signal transduction protein